MASIHPRTNKSGKVWQVRWRVDGKPRTRIAQSHEEARRVKLAVELHGDYIETAENTAGVPTVREQAVTFLAVHTRGNADTVRDYRRIIDQHISPSLGDVMVTALNVSLLTTWARGLDMADKTRSNVTAVLSGILESAVPEWLPANPWRKVRLEPRDGPKDRHFLTDADFGLILDEIPEHYRPLVSTLGTTGIRWGEAAAMTVADCDLTGEFPVLRVTKAVKHGASQTDKPGTPKSKKSVRFVTAPAELVGVYRALTDRPRDAPLFPALKGGRLRNSTFHTLVWQPALDRAQGNGLAFRPRIHDLRAAATTWLIESGMRPDEVADMMGHESLDTTMGIYRRANPQAGRKAAAAMSAVLARAIRPQITGTD